MSENAGRPDARVFRHPDGHPVTGPDELTEGWHRQLQLSTGLLFDQLETLAPDLSEFPAPYEDPL